MQLGELQDANAKKGWKLLQFPPFLLDICNESLVNENGRIPITPKAFLVLAHLVSSAGNLVTKDELLRAVWPNTFVGDAVLKTCIGELRRALQDESKHPRYIETIHRRGYRFVATVVEAPVTHPVAEHPASSFAVPETHYARSGKLNIAYQVFGSGPVDLIFVMGWVSHLEYFWTEPSFARFLRRLGSFARVILFDKRGTGLSDRVPIEHLPTLEERMDDVRAVMQAANSEHAVICGISEGGVLSALFAATYPAKTISLITIGSYAKRLRDDSYPWGVTVEEREVFYKEILERWGGPVGVDERAPSAAHDQRFRDWWATYLRMGASPGAALALTRMNSEIDVRSALSQVRVPTLVLHRTHDRCLSVEEGRYMASLIPGSRFVELPGIDHLPFVGDQEAVLSQIEDFVLGRRPRLQVDRVLATVLVAQFFSPSADAPVLWKEDSRREVEWFRGRRSHFEGNTLVAVFDGPARAVRCAQSLLERVSWSGMTGAVGLHTGECDLAHPTVSGPAVTVASQVAGSSLRGEIRVTNTVRDLTAGSGLDWEEIEAGNEVELPRDLRLAKVKLAVTPAPEPQERLAKSAILA